MKKLVLILFLVLSITLLCGCQKNRNIMSKTTSNNKENIVKENDNMNEFTNKINITINNKTFSATIEDNETTREFLKRLPLSITMNELNGNEKYYYFANSLPSNSKKVNKIATGDIMLYGNNCLVLFYDNFNTSYSYTRIGKLDNSKDLKNIIGNENIDIFITK